jgi:hypothetical protein
MSTLALMRRSYTPLAFKPATELRLTIALTLGALVVWGLVIPLEFVLASR